MHISYIWHARLRLRGSSCPYLIWRPLEDLPSAVLGNDVCKGVRGVAAIRRGSHNALVLAAPCLPPQVGERLQVARQVSRAGALNPQTPIIRRPSNKVLLGWTDPRVCMLALVPMNPAMQLSLIQIQEGWITLRTHSRCADAREPASPQA